MPLGVRSDRNIEIANTRQILDQVGRIRESFRMRLPGRLTLRWITTQRDQMAHTLVPVLPRDIENFTSRSPDAGEVGRAHQRSLALDPRNEVMSALARRAVSAISHRNKARRQRRQSLDRLPESRF